jgi:hypothetical protein
MISGDFAKALPGPPARLVPIGYERVRGIVTEIPIFEYRVARDAAPPAEVSARQPMAFPSARGDPRLIGAGRVF